VKTNACIPHVLILDEIFMTLDKPLGVVKCEHIKKLNGFAQIGISVKVDWVCQFWGFAGVTSM